MPEKFGGRVYEEILIVHIYLIVFVFLKVNPKGFEARGCPMCEMVFSVAFAIYSRINGFSNKWVFRVVFLLLLLKMGTHLYGNRLYRMNENLELVSVFGIALVVSIAS